MFSQRENSLILVSSFTIMLTFLSLETSLKMDMLLLVVNYIPYCKHFVSSVRHGQLVQLCPFDTLKKE